jgi:CRP-like cAMP-binding protein
MPSFEKYKPHLKPGQITPQGEKLILEVENPIDQIVLPIELVDFLILCNGELSVGEIIAQIYARKGVIQFKSIYRTLLYLKVRGFLINGDELHIQDQNYLTSKNERLISFRPLFEINIAKRVYNEVTRPVWFYLIAMSSIMASLLCLQLIKNSWFSFKFINLDGSYFSGALFIFLVSSFLLTAKNLFKCLLLILLTGRAYNFGFVFNGFSFYFRVKSDSLFLVSNKLYLALFHIAASVCYFGFVGVTYTLIPALPHLHEAMGLGLLLFLVDINPFQESEVSYMLKWLFNDDNVNRISNYLKNRPLFSLVHPLENNRDQSLYLFFTQISLAWCTAVFYSAGSSLVSLHDLFLNALRNPSWIEKIFSVMSTGALIAVALIVAHNAFYVLYMSLLAPLTQLANNYLRHRKSHRLDFYNSKEILAELRKLPLFSYLNRELIEMIVGRSELKEYKRGAPVIVQGDTATHIYVLIKGSLQVRLQQSTGLSREVSEILPVSIFGEIAVIEEAKRSAGVVTTRDSIVLEIPASQIRQIADENLHSHEIESFRNAILVNQFFTSAPVFRDLSEEIMDQFISKGKIEAFKSDQIIFRQGDPGDGFYLILRGSVGVSVGGKPISRIKQGGFFGEISMIADVSRTATVYAIDSTQVLKIGREAFWDILSLDINMAMFIESVGEMRIREDIEIIKSGKNQVA